MRVPFRLVFSLLIAMGSCSVAMADARDSVRHLDFEPRDTARDRVVPLRIYLPRSDSPRPVVLFSHGLGGSRENSPYLGNHWAAAGFVCVFMQHAGSDEAVWKNVPLRERMTALKQALTLKSSTDRFKDVPFVIDQLENWNQQTDHPLFNKLDLQHIGMSGHSYGAISTLAAAGRKFPLGKSFQEPRIQAFLAMSPSPGKGFSAARAFSHIQTPLLCMTGTEDESPIDRSTTAQRRREVYQELPPGDKYELVFDGGVHMTFSDTSFRRSQRDPDHHPAIQKISLKFWQAYLQDDDVAKKWLQSDAPRTACKLKPTDVWQWK